MGVMQNIDFMGADVVDPHTRLALSVHGSRADNSGVLYTIKEVQYWMEIP